MILKIVLLKKPQIKTDKKDEIMFNKNLHNRQSRRLKHHDYSEPGYYFLTICVADQRSLFGKIFKGKMILNDYGCIAKNEWLKTGQLRDHVKLDEFVVMPDHMHGILILTSKNSGNSSRDTARRVPARPREFGKPTKNSIPTIVQSYKSAVTKQINDINNHPGNKIWQKNYHDKIIRNRKELENVKRYIRENPMNS